MIKKEYQRVYEGLMKGMLAHSLNQEALKIKNNGVEPEQDEGGLFQSMMTALGKELTAGDPDFSEGELYAHSEKFAVSHIEFLKAQAKKEMAEEEKKTVTE